ncbi:MAG: DEAD/DEAH box helicase [Polyangiales bacterium]
MPPVSLADLNRIRADLIAAPFLPAADSLSDAPERWSEEARPARFGNFLVELLSAATVNARDVPADAASVRALVDAVIRGDAVALHRDLGSCLYPQHPAFSPITEFPKAHAHARVHPLDGADAAGDTWAVELGLLHESRAFLPLSTLAERGALHHPLVEHDDAVFVHPDSVLERDWSLALSSYMSALPALTALPELLTGRARLSDAQAQSLLREAPVPLPYDAYTRWLEEVRLRLNKRPRNLVAFDASPGSSSTARVRVHWDLLDDPDDPSRVGLHSARFVPRLEVALGDDVLTAADAERFLLSGTESFLRVQGHVLPRAELASALELLRAREKVLRKLGAHKGLNYAGAVALDDEWASERAAQAESIFSQRWESFLSGLRDGAGVPQLTAPEDFRGALRPYQQRGLSWLAFLAAQGFGGCLADDMGLGKTVQVLALLATRRADGAPRPRGPDLVVCPTAVVVNWSKEAKKFTPSLKVYVHQGLDRERDAKGFAKAAAKAQVVVTSFAIARRDEALLSAVRWGAVIVDEAQNLKNPNALQTRALRGLDAECKFGLTGTPVENHLRDLWSIFDVVVPGLLGGATRFARAFETPARNGDAAALARLSRRVGPFLLRRTKRDPAVAADLPPLQVQDLDCELTKEQSALYQAMTEAVFEGLTDKAGIHRRAHILAALTRFKQICDHPECFTKERPDKLFGRSGKLDRAMEVLEELFAEEQRAVIFTQFHEMGRILQRALATRLGVEADFYHGGLSASQREAVVESFQSPDGPLALVVSLKAGGTGLNLTAASAVIHYDRWWNPAVEDQATDRAHRIGQTRKVNVYRLVTTGTLEERVAELLDAKRALASSVLAGADESWITEMDDAALRRFLSLDGGAREEAS